jgi:hypothetical protein
MILNEIEIHFQFEERLMPYAFLLILTFLIGQGPRSAWAQAGGGSVAPPVAPSIADNSFLIEEAYNQEDGVIQHINAFLWLSSSRDWVYTETDEWPLRSQKHQLSMTLMATHAGSFPASGAGWGDTALNYRYQLLGDGDAKLALAPRLTVLFPTGDSAEGRGSGGFGLQTNLPLSLQHTNRLFTHWNAGATWTPRAHNEVGATASAVAANLGQSIVWKAKPRVNFLLETVWSAGENVVAAQKTEWAEDLYVSPGIRWAYNFRSGLQIVPGFAVPFGVGPSAGEKGVIVYLSFEHPFGFAHSRQ